MGDYDNNRLDYNLKVHNRSDDDDCEELHAGSCDYTYETYVSKRNLPPFEHYDIVHVWRITNTRTNMKLFLVNLMAKRITNIFILLRMRLSQMT